MKRRLIVAALLALAGCASDDAPKVETGTIVGEVFIGLLQLDPNGFMRVQPNWRPTLPSQTPGTFKMTDLLRWARVDPASRGQ